MAPLLGFKLGTLLIRTLTKPIAASLKSHAAKAGPLRTLCLRYGQLHHRIESRLSLRLLGHTAKSIKQLPEDAAVQVRLDSIKTDAPFDYNE
jgi:optic atrophy 3 protein